MLTQVQRPPKSKEGRRDLSGTRRPSARSAVLTASATELHRTRPAAGSSASLTLPQAIFLSRLLEARGRSFPPRLVWELARVSESTFWRAVKSFDLAVGKAAGEHPELNDVDEHRRVAEIVRRDLFPEFTRLWTGSLEVHTFRQAHTTDGGRARKNSRPTKPKGANDVRRSPGAPEPNNGHPSQGSAKRPVRGVFPSHAEDGVFDV